MSLRCHLDITLMLLVWYFYVTYMLLRCYLDVCLYGTYMLIVFSSHLQILWIKDSIIIIFTILFDVVTIIMTINFVLVAIFY